MAHRITRFLAASLATSLFSASAFAGGLQLPGVQVLDAIGLGALAGAEDRRIIAQVGATNPMSVERSGEDFSFTPGFRPNVDILLRAATQLNIGAAAHQQWRQTYDTLYNQPDAPGMVQVAKLIAEGKSRVGKDQEILFPLSAVLVEGNLYLDANSLGDRLYRPCAAVDEGLTVCIEFRNLPSRAYLYSTPGTAAPKRFEPVRNVTLPVIAFGVLGKVHSVTERKSGFRQTTVKTVSVQATDGIVFNLETGAVVKRLSFSK